VAAKKVVGTGSKRKPLTPIRGVLPKPGSDSRSDERAESEDSSFKQDEDGEDDEDEESEQYAEEAAHDDSSNNADSLDDSMVQKITRDFEVARAVAARACEECEEDEQEFEAQERRCEELRLRAQKGAEDPPNRATPTASTHAGLAASLRVPCGLSSEESNVPREETHVKRRIVIFVKTQLFRNIKFVNSASMFQKAFRKVIEFEKVQPRKQYLFQLTYEKCFNKALNQKRSSCEQAGFKITKDAINKDFKKRGEEFFTIEEFCKLRRATSDREKRAFFWFFESFLECVCVGQERGEMQRRPHSYRRHEMPTIPKL
jgi:hypothetical protein